MMRISGFINSINDVPGTSKKLTDLRNESASCVPCELWYRYLSVIKWIDFELKMDDFVLKVKFIEKYQIK